MTTKNPRRIAYLLGAGASHGSAHAAGSTKSVLMEGLRQPLREAMHALIQDSYADNRRVTDLINALLLDPPTGKPPDIEQVITFLADSPSRGSRMLAAGLQEAFEQVLRTRLAEVVAEIGPRHSHLYAILIDMHNVEGLGEELNGFLTLNYDGFLEHAIEHHLGIGIDYGVALQPTSDVDRRIKVVKLHGSFDWSQSWPISRNVEGKEGHWIPPGIRKAKERWPFNALWGLGREILDCDVLRIVGCNLSPNDWDLVSLLFTTQYTHDTARPYEVEIIAKPRTAEEIKSRFPYLRARSLLELEDVGGAILSESLGTDGLRFLDLDDERKRTAIDNASSKAHNALQYWLRQRAEWLNVELVSIGTKSNLFQAFLEE